MKSFKKPVFSLVCLGLTVLSGELLSESVAKANPSAGISDAVAQKQWADFKNKYHRRYGGTEDNSRYQIFKRNLMIIADLNAKNKLGNGDAPFGVNQFSDQDPTEFAETHLNFRHSDGESLIERADLTHSLSIKSNSIPTSFDWRSKGAISDVKDQGQCGSCWAFSATEELESAIFLSTGQLPLLSAQQVNSCTPSTSGCNGGDTTSAFDYMAKNGVQSEASYPYTSGSTGQTGSCNYDASKVVAHQTGYKFVIPSCSDSGDMSCSRQAAQEPSMQQQVATIAPASICLSASTWQHYTGGVVSASSCSSDWNSMDHCVQLVGYTTPSSGSAYWVLRNQWGTSWGDKGYIYLEMGKNTCGVANEVTFVNGASLVNGPSPTPSPTVTPTASPTIQPSPVPTPSPSPTIVPTPTPTPSPTSPPIFKPTQAYEIMNWYTQSCLSVGRGSWPVQNMVGLARCSHSSSQGFLLSKASDGLYSIKNKRSGACLNVSTAGNSFSINQTTCNGTSNQKFDIQQNQDGSFAIAVKADGNCLDINWNGYGRFQLGEAQCNGQIDQVFLIQ